MGIRVVCIVNKHSSYCDYVVRVTVVVDTIYHQWFNSSVGFSICRTAFINYELSEIVCSEATEKVNEAIRLVDDLCCPLLDVYLLLLRLI